MEIYILNQSQKEKYKKRKSNHPNRITVIIILSLIVLILSIIIVYLYLHLNSQKAIIKELIRNNKSTPIKSDDKEKTLYNNEDNQSKTPIINNINNNNSTLKNQYHIQLEKVFDKYKNELNDEEKKNLKKDILDGFSSLFRRKFTKIDTIIFDKRMNTGNALFAINNYIYFCEILGCKKIYLSKKYWFIKKPIYDKELEITIGPFNKETYDEESTIYIKEETSFDDAIKEFHNKFIPVRTYILKDEIISNTKLKNMNDQDLIINIRSGEDVFSPKSYSPESYHQPPLCFYQTIIETFNFTNIYIVANGMENPVINEILKLYDNAKYINGTEEDHAGMILSAKNLVIGTSSFAIELMKFNDNLKNIFFYDIIDDGDKNSWHFTEKHWRPLKYNIFVMNPTKEYVKIMDPWKKQEIQFKQMINEKCNKKFTIVPSDFA